MRDNTDSCESELSLIIQGQSIKIEVAMGEVEAVHVTYAFSPSVETLQPIEKLIDYGAKLSAYSTEKHKVLSFYGTTINPKEAAIALIKTYRAKGISVEGTLKKLVPGEGRRWNINSFDPA